MTRGKAPEVPTGVYRKGRMEVHIQQHPAQPDEYVITVASGGLPLVQSWYGREAALKWVAGLESEGYGFNV